MHPKIQCFAVLEDLSLSIFFWMHIDFHRPHLYCHINKTNHCLTCKNTPVTLAVIFHTAEFTEVHLFSEVIDCACLLSSCPFHLIIL